MAQFARPISDISNTGDTWELSTGSTIYVLLDEVTPADSDYIYTENFDDDTCVLGLTSLTDPSVSTGHVIRYRYYGGSSGELQLALYQSTSKLFDLPQTGGAGSYTTVSHTLSTSEADSISDYTALRIQIFGTVIFTNIYFSWFEMEVPDAGGADADPLAFMIANIKRKHRHLLVR